MNSNKSDQVSSSDTEEIIRRMNVILFGFDISKLNAREQKAVEESTFLRWELEVEAERRNPKPEPIRTKAEELELRRIELQLAKKMKELDSFDRRNGVKPRQRKGVN
jgi:hypothetical protein